MNTKETLENKNEVFISQSLVYDKNAKHLPHEEPNQELNEEEQEENDEIDPMLLKAIYEANLKRVTSDDMFTGSKKPESKLKVKICKAKPLKMLSLSDFTKKIDEEIKCSQPKKFISKRADTKRKELGINEDTVSVRAFNPRKPPYNFVFNKTFNITELDITNNEDFPTL